MTYTKLKLHKQHQPLLENMKVLPPNPPILLYPAQLKTMKPEEYRLMMRNLELHYQDYMRDSQDSQLFGPDDRMQVENDYTKVTQHFDTLLRSMEKGNFFFLFCFNSLNHKLASDYSCVTEGTIRLQQLYAT